MSMKREPRPRQRAKRESKRLELIRKMGYLIFRLLLAASIDETISAILWRFVANHRENAIIVNLLAATPANEIGDVVIVFCVFRVFYDNCVVLFVFCQIYVCAYAGMVNVREESDEENGRES